MADVRVFSFHYTLKDSGGKTLDSSDGEDALTFLENHGNIIPGLERELVQLKVGDKKNIKVAAKEAYGEFNKDLVIDVPHSQFPDVSKIKKGDQFKGQAHDGDPHHSPIFSVLEVTDTSVKLDGNHPLAGQDLYFDVEVTEIRKATNEEIAHGHVHGPGGHHHH